MLQFLSVCNRASLLFFWLKKSKQRLGFFESPLFILLDIK